jgi:hypothetical protein
MMITLLIIYLVYLIIGTAINIFKRRTKFNVLGCGLVGYCGDRPADFMRLALLMKWNQNRGSDAAGVAIDDKIYKDAISAESFLRGYNFLFNNVPQKMKNFTFLGHDRQASSGSAKKKELAHPHGIMHEGFTNPVLIGVHNGTIRNILDLARKHNIEHSVVDNSDSQTLFKIIAKYSNEEAFKVLSEYAGAASILFYPMKMKNTLYVHRDPDRELYWWQKSETEMYISSIEDSLYAIGGDEKTVFEFNENIVFKFVKGKPVKSFKLEKRIPYYTPIAKSESKVKNYTPGHNVLACAKSRNASFTDYYHTGPGGVKDTAARLIGNGGKKNGSKKGIPGNGFVCVDYRYFNNGHPHTGVFYVTTSGKVFTFEADAKKEKVPYTQYWAIRGYMMKSEAAFNTLYNNEKYTDSNKKFHPSKFDHEFPFVIKKYSMYPVPAHAKFAAYVGQVLFFEPGTLTFVDKKATFTPVLSEETYTVSESGNIVLKIEPVKKPISKSSEQSFNEIKQAIWKVINTREECINFASFYKEGLSILDQSDRSDLYDNFVTEFLSMAADDEAITEDQAYEIRYSCECNDFNTKNLGECLDTVLDKYYSAYRDKYGEGDDSPRDLSFHEIDNEEEFTVEKHVDELAKSVSQSAENLSLNQSFTSQIHNREPENIEEIIVQWANTDEEPEVRRILIALALVLEDYGYMNKNEVTDIKTSDIKSATSRMETQYRLFKLHEKTNKVKNVTKGEEGKPEDWEVLTKSPALTITDTVASLYNSLDDYIDNPTQSKPKHVEHLRDALVHLMANNKNIDEEELKTKYRITRDDINKLLKI